MPVHLQTLVVVAFWGSLRLGEVIALQRRDVDLAAGTIQVARQRVEPGGGPIETEPKAASRRTIQLPSQAVDALTLWLAGSTNPSDFPDTVAALSKILDALRVR